MSSGNGHGRECRFWEGSVRRQRAERERRRDCPGSCLSLPASASGVPSEQDAPGQRGSARLHPRRTGCGNDIAQLAGELGMLVHPRFGDAAYGWVVSALQIQLLQRLWYLSNHEADNYGGDYYRRRLRDLGRRYGTAAVEVEGVGRVALHEVESPVNLIRLESISTVMPR